MEALLDGRSDHPGCPFVRSHRIRCGARPPEEQGERQDLRPIRLRGTWYGA